MRYQGYQNTGPTEELLFSSAALLETATENGLDIAKTGARKLAVTDEMAEIGDRVMDGFGELHKAFWYDSQNMIKGMAAMGLFAGPDILYGSYRQGMNTMADWARQMSNRH